MTLYFITSNKGKFEEVKSVLSDIEQLDIDLPEIQDTNAKNIVKSKITEAFNHRKGEFIVEDTSLYMDCLKGLPGPLVKWFLATIGNRGLFEIAKKLDNKNAEGRTIIGYAKDPKNIKFFEGSIRGEIVEPKSDSGFGWDPIFQPEGHSETFAEMGREKKNSISMRYIAVNKLKEFLA